MTIDNQIEVPQSFMLMYVNPGASRPNAPQDVVLARYGQCEDMACILAEQAQALSFRENLREREVLDRCHQGLLAYESDFSAKESEWVILRLAELLGWTALVFDDGAPPAKQ